MVWAVSHRLRQLVLTLFSGVVVAAGPMVAAADEDQLLRICQPDGQEIRFDRDGLENLPQVHFRTSTIWTASVIEFSGPTLKRILDDAGLGASEFRLNALNDYSVVIDYEDLTDEYPIIATRMDGEPFGVRESGPLWLVYPFDRGGFLSSERTYSSSIWQLISIECDP